MKWRRRPCEVEAVLFTGDNLEDVKDLVAPLRIDCASGQYKKNSFFIQRSCNGYERLVYFWKGRFVVKKSDGDIDSVEKEIFLAEYEKVSV